MSSSIAGVLLGLAVGLRHAFEPDHLTAVATLATETRDARRGAVLGALWGLGHTLALVVVGAILIALGEALPVRLAAAFELAVSRDADRARRRARSCARGGRASRADARRTAPRRAAHARGADRRTSTSGAGRSRGGRSRSGSCTGSRAAAR